MDHIRRDRQSLEKGLDPYLVLSDDEIKRIEEYNKRNRNRFRKISDCDQVKQIWEKEETADAEKFQKMFKNEKVKIEEARWVRKVNEKERRKREREEKKAEGAKPSKP